MFSSSSDQMRLLTPGSKWLCHLSRHCFPLRPSRPYSLSILSAIIVHFFNPNRPTNSQIAKSSTQIHAHLSLYNLPLISYTSSFSFFNSFTSKIYSYYKFILSLLFISIYSFNIYSLLFIIHYIFIIN